MAPSLLILGNDDGGSYLGIDKVYQNDFPFSREEHEKLVAVLGI